MFIRTGFKFAKYYLKNLRLLQQELYDLYSLSDYSYAEKAALLRKLSIFRSVTGEAENSLDFDLKDTATQTLMIFLSRLFFDASYRYGRKNFELLIY